MILYANEDVWYLGTFSYLFHRGGKMDDKVAYDNDFFRPGSVSSVIWWRQSCQFELPIILNIFGWDISDSLCFLEARKTTFFFFKVAYHFFLQRFLIMQLWEGLGSHRTRAFWSCGKSDMLKLRLVKLMFEKWHLRQNWRQRETGFARAGNTKLNFPLCGQTPFSIAAFNGEVASFDRGDN